MTPALYIYFGLGTLAYLGLITATGTQVLYAWYVYQGCRLAAYGAFAMVVLLANRRPHAVPH
jgi:hypothetical protein